MILEGIVKNCETTSWRDGDKIEYNTHFRLATHSELNFCLRRVPLPIHNGLYAKINIEGNPSPLKQDFDQIEEGIHIKAVELYKKKDGILLHKYEHVPLIKSY